MNSPPSNLRFLLQDVQNDMLTMLHNVPAKSSWGFPMQAVQTVRVAMPSRVPDQSNQQLYYSSLLQQDVWKSLQTRCATQICDQSLRSCLLWCHVWWHGGIWIWNFMMQSVKGSCLQWSPIWQTHRATQSPNQSLHRLLAVLAVVDKMDAAVLQNITLLLDRGDISRHEVCHHCCLPHTFWGRLYATAFTVKHNSESNHGSLNGNKAVTTARMVITNVSHNSGYRYTFQH